MATGTAKRTIAGKIDPFSISIFPRLFRTKYHSFAETSVLGWGNFFVFIM